MRRTRTIFAMSMLVGATLAFAQSASAATCRNTANFDRWLADFKNEAVQKGISPQVIAAVSPYMVFSQRIINHDRAQGVFNQSFLTFSDRMTAGYRQKNGLAQMKKHAALFAKVEQEFGVPAAPLTAFWGLESDYGRNTGKSNVFTAITTLAYDCRRGEYFRENLLDALRIVQKGDLTVEDMLGGDWAGELGAMQFTASDYFRSAVDYDGDGRRDLVKSTPDTVASAANFLKSLGWKRGEPWMLEVRIPQTLRWEETGLEVKHPVSQWSKWGVRGAHARLPDGNLQASLLLPMGRHGPAFLVFENFTVLMGWNQSMVYVTTVAYFATRLDGAPPVSRGAPDIELLDIQQARELQRLLIKNGHDIGEVDGKVGEKTRGAIKKMQIKLGLPADSWPTSELIRRMGGTAAPAAPRAEARDDPRQRRRQQQREPRSPFPFFQR
ncbi:MAG: lytic murein transglycosylase [Pseudolabrys sp.]